MPTPEVWDVDPDFMEGMIHVCDIYVDANAGGGATTRHGAAPRKPVPVPGYAGVRCLCDPLGDAERDLDHRRGATVRWLVMFGQFVPLTQDHMILFTDGRGAEHRLWVQGQPRVEHENAHHMVADCIEDVN